jgi:hypothetical protein
MNDRVLGAPPIGPVEAPAPSQGQRVGADAGAPAIAGTWELLAFESRDSASGEVAYPLGAHPQGILIYDGRRMAVQLLDPDRPRFASGDRARGTDAEIRAAFVGSFAYYGRYDVDAPRSTITHHVDAASFPNWAGTDLVREFRLDRDSAGRDRLTLSTPPTSVGGRRLTTTLVWLRTP